MRRWSAQAVEAGGGAIGKPVQVATQASAASCEQPAVDPVLRAYFERRSLLLRYFQQRLGGDDAAEDVVQDMYLKIVSRPPGAIDNALAFLFRLGSNLMLDRVKRERR